jgi:predicted RNA-binding Zn-ribbon protein involved in translation (DUF1610 family)
MPARTDHPVPVASPVMLATMRAWRAAHPQATFAAIEREARRQVAALEAELIAVALDRAEPAEVPACPDCGRAMVRNGTRTRTITASHGERVTCSGARYRCSACGAELFPPR